MNLVTTTTSETGLFIIQSFTAFGQTIRLLSRHTDKICYPITAAVEIYQGSHLIS